VVGFSTAHRRAALKAVGNAVVPQVAEVIGRAVMALEAEIRRARE
jgi:site-specific DNA-cytosine methylase